MRNDIIINRAFYNEIIERLEEFKQYNTKVYQPGKKSIEHYAFEEGMQVLIDEIKRLREAP